MVKRRLGLVGIVSLFSLAACGMPVDVSSGGSVLNALRGGKSEESNGKEVGRGDGVGGGKEIHSDAGVGGGKEVNADATDGGKGPRGEQGGGKDVGAEPGGGKVVATVGVDGVQPGNVTCPDGYDSIKVDPPAEGTYNGATFSVTVTNLTDTSFDWNSTGGVDLVIVKGGPVSNVLNGDKLAGGTAQSAPNPDNGGFYGISHLEFCHLLEPGESTQLPIDKDSDGEDPVSKPPSMEKSPMEEVPAEGQVLMDKH